MLKKITGLVLCLMFAIGFLPACGKEKYVSIEIWHYYNSEQAKAFTNLVSEFNKTVGNEKGIIITEIGQGSISDLQKRLLSSAKKETGKPPMPDMFLAYADSAYDLDTESLAPIADLGQYFTEEEVNLYVKSYMEEGQLNGALKIFPIAKATEIMLLNKTDWDKFTTEYNAANPNGKVSVSDLETIDGLTDVAQKYFDYTKQKTGVGKALYSRDANANFFLSSYMQLGKPFYTVGADGRAIYDFDKEVIKKIWDNSYVPYIKGLFSMNGKYATDDISSGASISLVGSNTGVKFFPEQIVVSSTEKYDVEMMVLPMPSFTEENYKVQQGAGICVTKTNEKTEKACVEFIKWFTATNRNITFSGDSGYLPVQKAASNYDTIKSILPQTTDKNVLDMFKVAIPEVNSGKLFAPKPYKNSNAVRNLLEGIKTDKAKTDLNNLKAQDNAIAKAIEDGETQADILALQTKRAADYNKFLSNEYFEEWYTAFVAKVNEEAAK